MMLGVAGCPRRRGSGKRRQAVGARGRLPPTLWRIKKKEKYIGTYVNSEVKILENEIVSFNKFGKTTTSFRVYKDGVVGVHFQQGKMTDKKG